MIPTATRLASSVSTGPLKLKSASAQLLPPLSLYRRLLRCHRRLPEDMRFMGDSYVKSEFRRTKTTDNPIHIIGFLSQWKLYLDEVEAETARATGTEDVWRGRKMSEETFEKLSNEQAGQLYELMHATKDVWKTPEELEAQAAQQELDDANAASDSSDPGTKTQQ